jgi:hypothetical protein
MLRRFSSSLLRLAAIGAVTLAACSSPPENDDSQVQDLNGCPHSFAKKNAGGTVLTNVGIVNIYWGAWWTTETGRAARAAQDAAWKKLAADARFYRPLQEYMPEGTTLHGQFLASAALNPGLDAQQPRMTNETMEAELASEIESGALPAPPGGGGATPLYFIYLPPYVDGPPLLGPKGDEINYLAFHHYMKLPGSGTLVAYGIARNDMPNELDLAEAHEIDEMITNPFDDGWRDHMKDAEGQHAEVADACNGLASFIDDLEVQQVWSQKACGCVDPDPTR